MPALKPRDGYQAISIEEIPQGAKVNPNGGKGAIVKGVRGLCKQSGVGSDDSYSVTVRVLPEMKDSISHFVETENRPRAAVVREAIELGLLLKQKGLTVEDLLGTLKK